MSIKVLKLRVFVILIAMMGFMPILADEASETDLRGTDKAEIPLEKLPEKRPKVESYTIDSARQSKFYKEIVEAYDSISALHEELRKCQEATGDSKTDRKNKVLAAKVSRKIETEKTNQKRIYVKLKRPLAKEYNDLNDKYDKFHKDAIAAEAIDNTKRAERASQEADKIAEKMDAIKEKIDTLDYFMFYDNPDGDTGEMSEEGDTASAEAKSGDKKGKKSKEKKSRNKKSKDKDGE